MLAYDTGISGTDQKTWPLDALQNSGATWKFVISSVPWNRTVEKDDAWYTYRCEQDQLLNYIVDNNITGVVFISGDIHSGGAIDDGTNALCPELSVPNTNAIPTMCGNDCGAWYCDDGDCFVNPGIGYGLVEVNPTAGTATLMTKGFIGGVPSNFSHTLSEGNTCTSPGQ